MIPKPFAEIQWSDLEACRDSEREEDDTIEFKGEFSGGNDLLAMNDTGRRRAAVSLAREAIAFLNARGGDIVVGAREAKNEHPRIDALTPVANVDATVDRLAHSLAAIIEPMQSVLQIRSVKLNANDSEGIVVIRAPASLRAPHRLMDDKECYVRRGRSSVKMPMDEIQDLAVTRSRTRLERDELLQQQFADLASERLGVQELSSDRVHFRICFVPDVAGEVQIDQETLSNFSEADPKVTNGKHSKRNETAFRSLILNWRHQLRGRMAGGYHEYNGNFDYCMKSIYKTLMMKCDFACHYNFEQRGKHERIVHYDWVVGFFANALKSMQSVVSRHAAFGMGRVRIACYFGQGHKLVFGERLWAQHNALPVGVITLPDFEVDGLEAFDKIFQQAQIDICAIAGIDCPEPFSFLPQ